MRVLVDEGMPVQVLPALRLNKQHEFDHIEDLHWKGKQDTQLFADAAARRYDAVLTLDLDELASVEEARALKRSGLHHIGIHQGRSAQGIRGIARVISSVIVAMPYVLADLDAANGQRIVELTLLSATRRHQTIDPRRNTMRFPYWR
jgi:PIN like domain